MTVLSSLPYNWFNATERIYVLKSSILTDKHCTVQMSDVRSFMLVIVSEELKQNTVVAEISQEKLDF